MRNTETTSSGPLYDSREHGANRRIAFHGYVDLHQVGEPDLLATLGLREVAGLLGGITAHAVNVNRREAYPIGGRHAGGRRVVQERIRNLLGRETQRQLDANGL